MRLRLLRPVNGWAGFVTELAIVVLGVLIALGAQQLVDDWHSRNEVADFRKAVDAELAYNLGTYERRLEQVDCAERRLDQLKRWREGWELGRRTSLTHDLERPIGESLRTSVWNSQTNDISAYLPLATRLAYAALYDEFNNYDSYRREERAIWYQLREYPNAPTLDHGDLMRLGGLIARARVIGDTIKLNWPAIKRPAARLGIEAQFDPNETPWPRELCEPLTFEPV